MNIDPQQFRAHIDPSTRIIVSAAAGSGKSRTLIARILRLINDGIQPQKIIAITYTNAGAKVMQQRLQQQGVTIGYVGTLHSFMLRLLKQHGTTHLGLPQVAVMDEKDAKNLLDGIVEELKVTTSGTKLDEAIHEARICEVSNPSKTQIVAREYLRRQQATGELDYDALLHYGLKLVKLLTPEEFSHTHLLCDEIQDASLLDWQIYDAIPVKEWFWVGDVNQSIYEFRGACPKMMLARMNSMDTQSLAITTNYRSAKSIIEASNRLIAHNTGAGLPSLPRPDAPNGNITYKNCINAAEELAYIGHKLNFCGTAAVLYRSNALADQARDYFRSLGIKIAEQQRPDTETEMHGRTLLGYLANPWSDRNAYRLLVANAGNEAAAKVAKLAAAQMTTVAGIFAESNSLLIQAAEQIYETPKELAVAIGHCAGSSYLEALAQTIPAPFTIGDLVVANRDGVRTETHGVYVGTVHSAKGREWDTVYLAGCEAELWDDDDQTEQERRLFYVGMTRAIERLVITYVAQRQNAWRKWEVQSRTPSRFIKETL
jgi:DNA helicase-2/ATP-dependent DNA helicase PcrA